MEVRLTRFATAEELFVGECEETEDALWHWVAQSLSDAPIPCSLRVEGNGHCAFLDVQARGSWFDDDGTEHPSMYVVPVFNEFEDILPHGNYPDAYLTCIHEVTSGSRGNYKFYWMSQLEDGRITAKYGRIGQGSGFGSMREIREPFPSWMYWIRLYEKLSKGYRIQDVYLDKEGDGDSEENPPEELGQNASRVDVELFALTLSYARNRLVRSLVQGTDVTRAQYGASKTLVKELQIVDSVQGFNQVLKDLMQICPRKCNCVSDQLARKPDDFQKIIDREQSLVEAMDAVIASRGKAENDPRCFKEFGVNVAEAGEKDLEIIEASLSPEILPRLSRAWVVDPVQVRERFERRIAERGIEDRRMLWHGSRNENWNSIIRTGLVLNPDAQRTGAMFGRGLYFADYSRR